MQTLDIDQGPDEHQSLQQIDYGDWTPDGVFPEDMKPGTVSSDPPHPTSQAESNIALMTGEN